MQLMTERQLTKWGDYMNVAKTTDYAVGIKNHIEDAIRDLNRSFFTWLEKNHPDYKPAYCYWKQVKQALADNKDDFDDLRDLPNWGNEFTSEWYPDTHESSYGISVQAFLTNDDHILDINIVIFDSTDIHDDVVNEYALPNNEAELEATVKAIVERFTWLVENGN